MDPSIEPICNFKSRWKAFSSLWISPSACPRITSHVKGHPHPCGLLFLCLKHKLCTSTSATSEAINNPHNCRNTWISPQSIYKLQIITIETHKTLQKINPFSSLSDPYPFNWMKSQNNQSDTDLLNNTLLFISFLYYQFLLCMHKPLCAITVWMSCIPKIDSIEIHFV